MAELVRPSIEYKESFIEAIKEFQEEGRNIDFSIEELEKDFDSFLRKLENESLGVDLKPGRVRQTVFWLVEGGVYLGRVSVRHELTEHLRKEGGHIGYEIRPSQRRKGYGTKILELALPRVRELGISPMLVTCDDDNIGSLKIIEKNGGVLENTEMGKDKLKRRYWIK